MKLNYPLLLLLLITQAGFSQGPYKKVYDAKLDVNSLAVSADGSALICGFDHIDAISTIIRVNSSGDVLFAKKALEPANFNSLALPGKSYLLGWGAYPDTCKFMKIDSTGTVLWSKGYYTEGISLYIDKMLYTSHNTFIISSGRVCFEMDEAGNLLWVREFGGGGNFLSITETSSGYLFSRWDYDGDVYNFGIIKTDFTGAIVWANNQWLHLGSNYVIFNAAIAESGGAIYACMSIDYKYSNQDPEGMGGHTAEI